MHVNCNGTSCLLFVGEEPLLMCEKRSLPWNGRVFLILFNPRLLIIISRSVTEPFYSTHHTGVEILLWRRNTTLSYRQDKVDFWCGESLKS
jgi:hypothetical protein